MSNADGAIYMHIGHLNCPEMPLLIQKLWFLHFGALYPVNGILGMRLDYALVDMYNYPRYRLKLGKQKQCEKIQGRIVTL